MIIKLEIVVDDEAQIALGQLLRKAELSKESIEKHLTEVIEDHLRLIEEG